MSNCNHLIQHAARTGLDIQLVAAKQLRNLRARALFSQRVMERVRILPAWAQRTTRKVSAPSPDKEMATNKSFGENR